MERVYLLIKCMIMKSLGWRVKRMRLFRDRRKKRLESKTCKEQLKLRAVQKETLNMIASMNQNMTLKKKVSRKLRRRLINYRMIRRAYRASQAKRMEMMLLLILHTAPAANKINKKQSREALK